MSESGVLYVVATPIGNLEDITLRATRTLQSVDVIAAEDTRSAQRLLSHLKIPRPELVSLFQGNEASRTQLLINKLSHGDEVAIICESGTPGISDPGERLIKAVTDAGIRVEVIPGPVAAITALVGSGLPTDRFLFLGFAPRESGARRQLFGSLRGDPSTVILYESADRVADTAFDLADAWGDTRSCVLARELTRVHEEYIRMTLGQLAEHCKQHPPRGQCTLVVAGAAPDSADNVIDVEAEMSALLRSGLGPKDAAQRLVVRTGKPRRQLYQLALSLMRTME